MKAIRYSLAFCLLAFFVGCDDVPTDAPDTADAALFAKGGNKPKPPGEDPPAEWTTAQEIVYLTSVTKKGNTDRRIVVTSVVENPDGTVGPADEAILLSYGEASVQEPAWSASGDAVLFSVFNGLEGRGIYAVRRDPATNQASAPEFLFPHVSGTKPVMSPDGSKIAYVDWGLPAPGDIWVRERAPDGSWGSPVNIDGNGSITGGSPAWAWDSHRLVATYDKDLLVYDIDPDGNGVIDQVSEMSITAGGPLAGQVVGGESSWARHDDRVVFGNYPGLWIIDFNDPSNITTCLLAANSGNPSWSPDDTKIVHGGVLGSDIRVMTLDPTGSQANGCPVVLSDDVIAAESSRCTGNSCQRVREPNWRRF